MPSPLSPDILAIKKSALSNISFITDLAKSLRQSRAKIKNDLDDYIANSITSITSKDIQKEDAISIAFELWTKHLPKKIAKYSRVKGPFIIWLKTVSINFAMDCLKKTASKEILYPDLNNPQKENDSSFLSKINSDYMLENVVRTFCELDKYESSSENIDQKDFIARFYYSLELTSFGDDWGQAISGKIFLGKSQSLSDIIDYGNSDKFLIEIYNKGIKSLSFHIQTFMPNLSLETIYYPYLIRSHYLEKTIYLEISKKLNMSPNQAKYQCELAMELFKVILLRVFENYFK